MRSLVSPRTIVMLALCVGFAACSGESATTVVPPGTLTPGTWYMHEANGDSLPTLIATRFVGIVTEETYLDSATITVVAGGAWEQRHYYRVFVSGALDRGELLFDRGAWAPQTAGYSFVSALRSRAFTGTFPFPSLLATTEPILTWTGAPSVTGNYRQTRP